jgi:hypothetical protein
MMRNRRCQVSTDICNPTLTFPDEAVGKRNQLKAKRDNTMRNTDHSKRKIEAKSQEKIVVDSHTGHIIPTEKNTCVGGIRCHG